jgi:hypothetical protein
MTKGEGHLRKAAGLEQGQPGWAEDQEQADIEERQQEIILL